MWLPRNFCTLIFKGYLLLGEMEVEVNIKLIGEAHGVKLQGGLLQHGLRTVTVSCLPTNIPKEFVVDVTPLKLGDAIRVKDLKLEKAKIINEPEHVIVNIAITREEVEPTPVDAAAAEPEVTEKGKKEDGDKVEDVKKADDGKKK